MFQYICEDVIIMKDTHDKRYIGKQSGRKS